MERQVLHELDSENISIQLNGLIQDGISKMGIMTS